MKLLIKAIFVISCLLLSIGCKKKTYQLNDEFSLTYNKSVFVNIEGVKYKVKFTSLEEDSRCPPDAYCYWMGQVAVKITVNDDTDLLVGHHTTIPSSTAYNNHFIHLLEVTYDKKQNFGDEKHCTIKLRIE